MNAEPDDRDSHASNANYDARKPNYGVSHANDNDNSAYDEDDDDELLYAMTDDQQKASKELQSLKLDLGFTAVDEPGPFYDVSARLRQLNEELAQEQLPDFKKRTRKIQFKENLVDLVAPPPPDLDMDDESEHNGAKIDSDRSDYDDSSLNSSRVSDRDKRVDSLVVSDDQNEIDVKKKQAKQTLEAEQDDKVIIERNGQFELIPVKDLTPQERKLYGVNSSNKSATNLSVSPKSSSPNAKPKTTKTGKKSPDISSGNHTRSTHSVQKKSTDSKKEHQQKKPSSARGDSNKMHIYRSASAVESQKKKKEEEEYERKRAEEEIQRQKQEDCDRNFQIWLDKKNEKQKKEKSTDCDSALIPLLCVHG